MEEASSGDADGVHDVVALQLVHHVEPFRDLAEHGVDAI
jgi:hypothetical protein